MRREPERPFPPCARPAPAMAETHPPECATTDVAAIGAPLYRPEVRLGCNEPEDHHAQNQARDNGGDDQQRRRDVSHRTSIRDLANLCKEDMERPHCERHEKRLRRSVEGFGRRSRDDVFLPQEERTYLHFVSICIGPSDLGHRAVCAGGRIAPVGSRKCPASSQWVD